jgi:phosphoserine aminotransferase
MLHYPTLTANNSLYNTLPIFEVYICGLVMKKLLETGGLSAMQASADRKADKIYKLLEKYESLFKVVPKKSVRSRMNICFRIEGEGLEGKFVKGGEERGLLGLKGHRSVGGIRISNCKLDLQRAAGWYELT